MSATSNSRVVKASIEIVMLMVLFLFLVSCSNDTNSFLITPHSPTPTSTPTCDPNILFETPVDWTDTSQLTVVLYDPKVIEQYPINLANDQQINNVNEFIEDIASDLLTSGSKLAVFELGYENYEDARVFIVNSYAEKPQLYNAPETKPSLTLAPTLGTPTPGYKYVATLNEYKRLSTIIAKTQVERDQNEYCQIQIWNDTVKTTADAFDVTSTYEADEMIMKINEDFDTYYSGKSDSGSQYRTDELMYGGLFNGLSFASNNFAGECDEKVSCKLIIIDDLSIWAKEKPQNLEINLDGVEIYAITPNYVDKNTPKCKDLSTFWESQMNDFGAASINFINNERVDAVIDNVIQ